MWIVQFCASLYLYECICDFVGKSPHLWIIIDEFTNFQHFDQLINERKKIKRRQKVIYWKEIFVLVWKLNSVNLEQSLFIHINVKFIAVVNDFSHSINFQDVQVHICQNKHSTISYFYDLYMLVTCWICSPINLFAFRQKKKTFTQTHTSTTSYLTFSTIIIFCISILHKYSTYAD